jgi:flagellar basal-body rod modification protein FlgD
MMVNAIHGAAPAATTPPAAPVSQHNQLGEKDFLLLLTTQLKQQDPTSPVDNKEMIAQMAQFSSLSGITQMNATLKSIADKLDAALAEPGALPATGTATPAL